MNDQNNRELEKWIAKNVFDWQWWHFDSSKREDITHKRQWCAIFRPSEDWPKKLWNAVRIDSPIVGMEEDAGSIPSYTTDRAAALEVFIKLKRPGWLISLMSNTNGIDCPADDFLCAAEFDGVEDEAEDWKYFEAHAPTPELAICLLAQKAAQSLFGKEGR